MECEKDLEFNEIWRTVKRQWKLIVILTALFTTGTAVFNFLILPSVYEAKTSLIIGQDRGVSDQRIQSDSVIAYQKMIKTYSEIVMSTKLANKVAGQMGRRFTAEQIQKAILVSPLTDTPILVLKFRWRDPGDAKGILQNLTESLIGESLALYPAVNIQIMDEPEVSPKPVQPKKALNLVIGFLVGLLVAGGSAFLREAVDSTFKTQSEVEKYMGIPVIGIIPERKQVGRA